jgi:hypothetical protein
MKGKIYTVATQASYDYYNAVWIRTEFIESRKERLYHVPIFAYSTKEAIEKYKNRYNLEKIVPFLWSGEARNISREVMIAGENNIYSLQTLKSEMNSQDFLEYCRQELLGIEKVID